MDHDLHVRKGQHQNVLKSANLDTKCLTTRTNILVNIQLHFMLKTVQCSGNELVSINAVAVH